MSYKIIFRNPALKELTEACEWYENKKTNLGERLLNDVENTIELLKMNPKIFQLQKNPFRQVHLNHFPYLIIFSIEKDSVVIYSFFHTSRNTKSKFKNR